MSKIKHFDFFGFPNRLIIVACDDRDYIMGYCVLDDGNELCHIYVMPSHRKAGLVHLLIWKAIEIVRSRGFSYIWGVVYDPVKKLYESYVERWGAKMEILETPEERLDGQWRLIFKIDEITPDRRPDLY